MSQDLMDLYTDYLISSFGQTTATGLSSLLDGRLSHDQITTFLSESCFDSKSLWLYSKSRVRQLEKSLEPGVLIIDDTISEKPYSDENAIVCYHWDHSKGCHIKGINLLNCLYENQGIRIPIAAEIIEKSSVSADPKSAKEPRRSSVSKNELMRQMLVSAQKNQVFYRFVLADSWFSSVENMKFIKKNLDRDFVLALRSNRLAALSLSDKLMGKFVSIDSIAFPVDSPCEVYIKGLNFQVSLIKQIFTNKDGSRGELYLACSQSSLDHSQISTLYQRRWSIEEFHKSLKSNLALEKSPARVRRSQQNHIFASIYAFVKIETLKLRSSMNHFAIKTRLYLNALKASFQELQRLNLIFIPLT